MRGLVLLPYIAPLIAVAFTWRWLLQPTYGIVPHFLQNVLGVYPAGQNIRQTMEMVILFDTWRYFPFAFLLILARVRSIPEELYEAAAIDGAEKWHQFRYITIPQLKSVILIATLLSTIWTFVSFDTIWTMTGGGPINSTATLVIWIYQVGLKNGNLGEGAAYSVIGFLFLLVFAVVYLRIYTRGGEEL
jgi:multiple sugar transport system permease protein